VEIKCKRRAKIFAVLLAVRWRSQGCVANEGLVLALQYMICVLAQRVLYYLNAFSYVFLTPWKCTQSHIFDVAIK
jgi:hypothetical protein